MRRFILIVVTVFVVTVPIAYTIYWVVTQGFDLADEYWAATLGNLLATVFGVAIAIPGGLWVDRWLERERQQVKQGRIIHLLRGELDEILQHKLLQTPGRPSIPPDYIDTGVWQASSASGDINSIEDVELLAEIFNAYQRVDLLNEWLRRSHDALYGVGNTFRLTHSKSGQQTPMSKEISKVVLNLASQERPYIEMLALKLRKIDSG